MSDEQAQAMQQLPSLAPPQVLDLLGDVLPESAFPSTCPFALDVLLDLDFLP
jgi:hypothetical protein